MPLDKFIETAEKVASTVPICITIPCDTAERLDNLAKIIKQRGVKTNRSKILQAMIDEYLQGAKAAGTTLNLKFRYGEGAPVRQQANITIDNRILESLDKFVIYLYKRYPDQNPNRSSTVSAIAHFKLDELKV